MNSKQELYFAMQRVINDMIFNTENSKQISFMEVAQMLARIGSEQAEPELLEMTNSLCSLAIGKGEFQVKATYGNSKIVTKVKNKKSWETVVVIKNTKEDLFFKFLGFIAKQTQLTN